MAGPASAITLSISAAIFSATAETASLSTCDALRDERLQLAAFVPRISETINAPLIGPLYFSAPPDAQGHAGVLTPEDAFVAAVNTCVMMMFIWSAERFKLNLISYECFGEGTKRIELDRTKLFTQVALQPRIVVRSDEKEKEATLKRLQRAMDSAVKYSLVANSIKSKIVIEPQIDIIPQVTNAIE